MPIALVIVMVIIYVVYGKESGIEGIRIRIEDRICGKHCDKEQKQKLICPGPQEETIYLRFRHRGFVEPGKTLNLQNIIIKILDIVNLYCKKYT